jgi:2-C-methyl-D-erythritol 4-phosphate cytidylyltransferase
VTRQLGPGGRTWALVLAAGSGARFGTPKQFVEVAGKRLVDLAVDTVAAVCDHVVLVLPPGRVWDGRPVFATAEGGGDRAASVRAGLAAIPASEGTVIVHQAANPLATPSLVQALRDTIADGAAAVAPGLRPPDVVRKVTGDVMGEPVGRDHLVLVQTPAAFRLSVLRAAHQLTGIAGAVEDTALVSAAGYAVRILPGDPRNVHVTSPADLDVVAALLASSHR